VAFRVLAAGSFPAHRTIRDFRALHLKALSDLFVQVVRLARETGLVKLGTIAVDGTKVKANASRHKAMSYGHRLKAEAELKAQIRALLQQAQQADDAEKNEPQLDVPAEIARREQRQRKAELTDRGSDAGELPVMPQAVEDHLGSLPEQVLADTGYEAEAVFEALADSGCDLVVAAGREGRNALRLHPQRLPHTAAMVAKLQRRMAALGAD
jgi:hypothetical protein